MNLWKQLVSVWILVHFGAILAVVLSAGSGERPAYVFLRIREPFTPYLQSLFFESPYRFYAPNPSHDDLLWIRVERSAQPGRWTEWPTAHPSASGPLAKRYASMTRLALEFTPGEGPGQMRLTETSNACFSSIVRGVVRSGVLDMAPGDDPTTKISVFFVRRRFLTPALIRAGHHYDDIRLMQIIHLGDYHSDGSPVAAAGSRDSSRVVQMLPTATFLAEVLQYDSGLLVGDEQLLPAPVDRFLRANLRELAAGSDANLVQSIERLLAWPSGSERDASQSEESSHNEESRPAMGSRSGRSVAAQEEPR